MEKKLIILLTLLLGFYIYPLDQTTDNVIKLDIDTAISKALNHNFSLKNDKIDLDSKTLLLATSWNKFIPSTSLQGSIGTNKSLNSVTTTEIVNGKKRTSTAMEETSNNSATLGFNTSLSLNAKTIFDINQLAIDWKNGLLTLDQARNQLKNNIKKYYYNLVILKEQLDLQNSLVENSKARFDTAILKLNLGVISELDKLKSEYDYKSALYNLSKMSTNYSSSLMQFKQLVGIDNNKKIDLITPIPDIKQLDFKKIPNESIEKNPDIIMLTQQLKSEENGRNSFIASLTPSLGFSYQFKTAFNKDPFANQWFADTYNDWDKSNMFSLSLSIPIDELFPFSSVQNNIITSQQNIQKIKNSIEEKKETVKNSLLTTILKLKEVESNIDSLNINASIAEETYKLAEKQYNLGGKNYLDLKDAENNMYDAKINILNAKYEYLSNLLDLQYLLNIEL
jgi:outer membrane protein TolC